MTGDPFKNYDQWLESPYVDAQRRADDAEWVREHSTYSMSCCGKEIAVDDVTFDEDGLPEKMVCPDPECAASLDHEAVVLLVDEPAQPDPEIDEPDDFDDRRAGLFD